MWKRSVFAFEDITLLRNHRITSDWFVGLKFSSLVFLGMQNLIGRNRTRHGEPNQQRARPTGTRPTGTRPTETRPTGTRPVQQRSSWGGSSPAPATQTPRTPRAPSFPAPVCCKAVMPFLKSIFKEKHFFKRRVFIKVLLLRY